tara:strand:- start:3898 stop:6342 length:2445 start_codon:yes stop_codon:yes gene_type:complete
MVKIKRYRKQTAATNKAPNTYSGIQYNPSDFSRASDAIARFGKTTQNVGLNLLEQKENNKAKMDQLKTDQELKMLETLEKQQTDMDVFQLKIDRENLLHEKMSFALSGTEDNPGLNSIANDYINNPDYQNNEENFINASKIRKDEILATIDDEVVKRDFSKKYDTKSDALKLNVMNGSFKTGLAQRTAAYQAEHKGLLYDLEFGNALDQLAAKNRLLGLNGVKGIHEEAFESGIINTTPELAEQYSLQDVEFIQAKLMIADDPKKYMDLAEGKTHEFPFKNLSIEQRATLDIKAKDALDVIQNREAANIKKQITANKAIVKDITDKIDEGIIIENGLIDLGTARAIATELGDTETVKNIDNYMFMWGTFQMARQSNPLDLDAKIIEVQKRIDQANTLKTTEVPPGEQGTQGVNPKDLLELKALTTIRTKMATELNNDSLKWANKVNKIDLQMMDLTLDADGWKNWVTNRTANAELTAAIYGTKRDFLTKDEQKLIMNYWQSDNTSIDDKVLMIARLAEFGVDADNVFEEILTKGDGKKEAGYFAHIAGLMNSNPNSPIIGELAADFFNGFAKRLDFSNPPTELLLGEERNILKSNAQEIFNDHFNGSLIHADPTLNRTIFDMANLIYLDKGNQSTKQIDKKIYKNILNELVGGTTIGGVNYGGLTEYNGQETFVPSWMATDDFEKVINSLRYDEWDLVSAGQVPLWNNGSNTGEFELNGDVFNRNFDSSFFEEATQSLGERRSDLGNYDQPYLWVVGDGKYIVSFNSPLGSEDPQYLATKNNDNGYFVLDLNQIKDKYLNKELVAQKNPNWIIE